VTDGRGAVVVQVGVIVRADVATREILLNPSQEVHVYGHNVFVVAVDGAVLHHPDLAVALDDLRFDLAHLLVQQILPILLAIDDGLAGFLDAARAKRVGLTRETQLRLSLLPGLQKRFLRPLRRERRPGIVLVEELNRVERRAGDLGHRRVHVFHQPLTTYSWHANLSLDGDEPPGLPFVLNRFSARRRFEPDGPPLVLARSGKRPRLTLLPVRARL